jgi:hypothetical protein
VAITVSCKCGKQFKVKDHLAGKAVRCPNCKSPLRIPGGAKVASSAASPKIDTEGALLRFEEAQKKKIKTAEEEAAYRAEQNKLIESYDQLTGKAKPTKEGEKEQPKKRITEALPKKRTLTVKLADAVGTVLGNLLVKYIMIAAVVGAVAYGSVVVVKLMTGGIEGQVQAQVPKEQRRKDLMKEIPLDIENKKWSVADTKLNEIDSLDHKFKTMNRDYQRYRKEVDDALKAASAGKAKPGGGG